MSHSTQMKHTDVLILQNVNTEINAEIAYRHVPKLIDFSPDIHFGSLSWRKYVNPSPGGDLLSFDSKPSPERNLFMFTSGSVNAVLWFAYLLNALGVIKWRRSPHCWPFVRGIHQSLMESPHKGPTARVFDVLIDVSPHKRLNKQSSHC